MLLLLATWGSAQTAAATISAKMGEQSRQIAGAHAASGALVENPGDAVDLSLPYGLRLATEQNSGVGFDRHDRSARWLTSSTSRLRQRIREWLWW